MGHRRLTSGRPLLHLPYVEELVRAPDPFAVILKGAQTGATEALINLALWAAATGFAGRGHVGYFMATQNTIDDLVAARVDPALQDSPALRRLLQPEPPRRKGADSRRLKRLGDGAIYFRGTESRKQLLTLDLDLAILDEYDAMDSDVIELAWRRLASSADGRLRVASTPRFPGTGIHALWEASDQRRYLLPCPGCGLEQPLRWPENVDPQRAAVVCRACGAAMDVRALGRWEAQAPGNAYPGYHLSRLYSPWLNLPTLLAAAEDPTPAGQQEFFNADLGEPFTPAGGGLTFDSIDRCRGDYVGADYAGQVCVMGVDVGLKLHAVVRELPADPDDADAPRPLWCAAILDDFAQLDALMAAYHVEAVVIDGQPEVHKVAEFAAAHPAARAAWYTRHEPGHEWVPAQDGRAAGVRLYRTEAIDRAFQRFHAARALLPRDARTLGGRVQNGVGEYYRELSALQRTLEPDAAENLQWRWVNGGRPDHFAHAEVYCVYAEEARPASIPLGLIDANRALIRPSPFPGGWTSLPKGLRW